MTKQIIQLLTVGDLTMDLWRAEDASENARDAYRRDIERYEAEHGRLGKFLRAHDPEHAAARDFTAAKYQALQLAKRRVYAIKVRIRKACTLLARLSAAESNGGAK